MPPVSEVQQKLKILLIDQSIQRSYDIQALLQSTDCEVIACIPADGDLLFQVEQYQPDMVIIDTDLPDRDMLENLRSVQDSSPRPMVMFSQDDDGLTIRRAIQAGVSAYVVENIQTQRVRPILEAAIATFDHYQKLHTKLKSKKTELENRIIIDRAKGLLMQQRELDEPQAYQLMRKSAMDQKLKMVEVAQNMINMAELFGVK